MNIQSNYSYNISMQGKGLKTNKPEGSSWKKFKRKIKQKVLDILPEKTFKGENSETDKYTDVNTVLSRPDVNRLIMGSTAILTQPWIDRYNHRVDEETRKVSMYRTISKIIAGTAVGILVRGSCYKLVDRMTQLNGNKKSSKALLPKAWIEKFERNPKQLKNYKSALSTCMALIIMGFCTNFLLDAPLTLWLTNKFTDKNKNRNKQNGKEVLNG
ncbi:MAG: hypothetical protein MJ230_04425 [bacterium]|nr:hypothetical protein [bacterium]